MWVVSVPTSVMVSKRKRWWLNLNHYRNAHHQTLDKAKKEFTDIVLPRLVDIPHLAQAQLSYILYGPSEQLCDVANVCSIVDKFFSDCMVKAERLTDDNRKYLPQVAYGWGGVDRDNPRVDVIIEPYDPN
jgi:hypothetical protein